MKYSFQKDWIAMLNLTVCSIALVFSITTLANASDLNLYVNDSKIISFSEKDGIFSTELELEKGDYSLLIGDSDKNCERTFGGKEHDILSCNNPVYLDRCSTNKILFKAETKGIYRLSFSEYNKVLEISFKNKKDGSPNKNRWTQGQSLTVDVSSVWSDGTEVKDSYSQNVATVTNGKISLIPALNSKGILLLEKNNSKSSNQFSWDNAIIYFMLTDRFNNGDLTNDHSFGRRNDYPKEKNFATWHGGDFKGITEKLDYLQKLGINAIWVSPIVEQIHGFDGQMANSDFPVYGYHGYWATDFTKIDPNLGSEQDFKNLIEAAHQRGIRIIVDMVINHAGYLNLADMQDFGYPQMANIPNLPRKWNDWEPNNGNYNLFRPDMRVTTKGWENWWTPQWIRLDHVPGFDHSEKGSDTKSCLFWLPDFKTESKEYVTLPKYLLNKKDTRAVNLPNATVLDYLISWQTYWIENFGIDGFRVDTARHVELSALKKLSEESKLSFDKWKQKNPNKKLDDSSFYLIGEVGGHGVKKDAYYENGFNSLINFSYQNKAIEFARNMSLAEPIYKDYSEKISKDSNFNLVSYVSTHDTKLIYGENSDIELQKQIANSFAMLPGQIQIYYGDESARDNLNAPIPDQRPRSDMNWSDLSKKEYQALYTHWMKLLNFRKEHKAIAEGTHKQISNYPYAFSRTKDDDTVVIVSGN